MIIQEIVRINDYYQLDLKFSYWQTGNGHEVDLILSRGLDQPMAAIEIKSSKTVNTKKLKCLYSFKKDYLDVPVYCFCQTPYPFTEDSILFLP